MPVPTGIPPGSPFLLSLFQTILQYAFTSVGRTGTTGPKDSILNQIHVFLLIRLTPPFGVILSELLLGEPIFRWQNGLSLLLICLGIGLSNLRCRRARE